MDIFSYLIKHLSEGFSWILSTSLMASILVFCILLIKRLFQKQLKPRWHYLIWIILIAKLVFPWTLHSPLSIHNLAEYLRIDTQEVLSFPIIDVEPSRPQESSLNEKVATTKDAFQPITTVKKDVPVPYTIFFGIWLSGVLFVGALTIRSNRIFLKGIRQCDVADSEIERMLYQCKRTMSMKRNIRLVESETINGPTLVGVLKPTIILPTKMAESLSEKHIRYILLHELVHVKRQDLALNWMMNFLLVLHWFNPILWYAYSRMREDQEVACDAHAMTYLEQSETKEYGRTIVSLLEMFSTHKQLPGTANLSGTKKQLKRRITMIKMFKGNTGRWSLLGIVLLLLIGGTFLTHADKGAQQEPLGDPAERKAIVEEIYRCAKEGKVIGFEKGLGDRLGKKEKQFKAEGAEVKTDYANKNSSWDIHKYNVNFTVENNRIRWIHSEDKRLGKLNSEDLLQVMGEPTYKKDWGSTIVWVYRIGEYQVQFFIERKFPIGRSNGRFRWRETYSITFIKNVSERDEERDKIK